MNILRPALLLPAVAVLVASAVTVFADCCGGRGGGSVSGTGSASSHGTLQELFGGSPGRSILLQNHNANHYVDFQLGGKTVTLAAGETKRRDFGGMDPATASVPPLPGEGISAKLLNGNGNTGSNSFVTQTAADSCPAPQSYDSTGTTGWEPAERVISLALPASAGTTTGPLVRTPVSTRGDGGAAIPSLINLRDFGYGGAVLSPGAVSLDSGGNIVVSKPGPMVAVSLGNSPDGGLGRLGYIIPTTTGGVYVFNDRTSYTVRGVSPATYSSGSGVGSVTRYKTDNGLAVLTQTSSTVLTFTFYLPTTFNTTSPYAPTGSAFRTMIVEPLSSGNPDNTKYSLGAKVSISGSGLASQTRTMWWNDSSSVLNAYTALSTGVTIVTSSTVPSSMSPVRNVDTTVTETFTDASGASKTIVHRTRDSVGSLTDGEEQTLSHIVYLTDNTAGPSLTTTYDYFPDTADAINRRTVLGKMGPTGEWEIFFQYDGYGGGWVESITLRGWKDEGFPDITDAVTWSEIVDLLYSPGIAASYTFTDPKGRYSYGGEWVDGFGQSIREDLITEIGGANAYPFAHAIAETGNDGAEVFDTYTYEVGWDSLNPTATAAESVVLATRS